MVIGDEFISEYEIRGAYDIGYVRRQITDVMKELGFSEKDLAEVSIIVNELCSNIVKHDVKEGLLKYYQIINEDRIGLEIVAEDKGPGIDDIDVAMKDGVSSKGTLGGGFGAIKRLSDYFNITSQTVKLEDKSINPGTKVTVRKWKTNPSSFQLSDESEVKISVMSRPYPGFTVNGDGYYIKSLNDREVIALIDGLGHGKEAHEAASLAVKIIDENPHLSVEECITTLNTALKSTRGAVVAFFVVYKFLNEFEMLSIGNIDARFISGNNTESLFSYNGYIGGYHGTIKSRKYNFHKGDILVLGTDGISTKWDFSSYANDITKNPTILCNTIFRDYSRQNDDATLLVAIL